jgi:hypothetical protein
MKQIKGFEKHVESYKHRLRLLRVIVAAGSQQDIADALSIDMKRWNNYERGYPLPRETAFLIMEKFPGMSAQWLWFGWEGDLSPQFKKKIREAETNTREREQALLELEQAKKKLASLNGKNGQRGHRKSTKRPSGTKRKPASNTSVRI